MEEKNKNKRTNIKGSYNSHNTIDKESDERIKKVKMLVDNRKKSN